MDYTCELEGTTFGLAGCCFDVSSPSNSKLAKLLMTIRLREMRRSAFCLLMGGMRNCELGASSSNELQLEENVRSWEFLSKF